MRLEIANLAQVKSADILIDGLTVIAGKNNTGKSTIGKTLFAVFNALYDIENKVKDRREQEIRNICNEAFRNYVTHTPQLRAVSSPAGRLYRRMTEDVLMEISKYIDSDDVIDIEDIQHIIERLINRVGAQDKSGSTEKELIENLAAKISIRLNTPNEKIISEVIGRYFQRVFHNQVNNLDDMGSVSEICLTIKQKELKIKIENNQCTQWDMTLNIMHEALYIDDPFVLDRVDEGDLYYNTSSFSEMQNHLAFKLMREYEDLLEGVFDAVAAKEKLKDIYELLADTMNGTLIEQNGAIRFSESSHENPLMLKNLSTGLKSFIIVKLLLEKGILKENDVLILDEPEVHLHPEWQLVYAEIVVLLQKHFDLSMVVTTHSAEFLEAIEYFSEKYSIKEKCNYYLASAVDGRSSFERVTDNLDLIYKEMVTPSMLLDKLRYEMETKENE